MMKEMSPIAGKIEEIRGQLPDIESLPDKDPDAHCDICDGYGHIDENGARPCICVRREVFIMNWRMPVFLNGTERIV